MSLLKGFQYALLIPCAYTSNDTLQMQLPVPTGLQRAPEPEKGSSGKWVGNQYFAIPSANMPMLKRIYPSIFQARIPVFCIATLAISFHSLISSGLITGSSTRVQARNPLRTDRLSTKSLRSYRDHSLLAILYAPERTWLLRRCA